MTLTASRVIGGEGSAIKTDVAATVHLRGNMASFLILRDTINQMEKAMQDDAARRAQTDADAFAGTTGTVQWRRVRTSAQP